MSAGGVLLAKVLSTVWFYTRAVSSRECPGWVEVLVYAVPCTTYAAVRKGAENKNILRNLREEKIHPFEVYGLCMMARPFHNQMLSQPGAHTKTVTDCDFLYSVNAAYNAKQQS
jgi:hypothetical protein